jgi:hypothetical protein
MAGWSIMAVADGVTYANVDGLREYAHEPSLVEAGFEEEPCEFRERLLAQIAPAVQIVPARQIAALRRTSGA